MIYQKMTIYDETFSRALVLHKSAQLLPEFGILENLTF